MAKKLKKVSFTKDVGKMITRKIKIAGYEPFDITFRQPSPSVILADMRVAETLSDQSRGEFAVDVIARHIESWSFDPEPTRENITALADDEILLSIFNEIISEVLKVKN